MTVMELVVEEAERPAHSPLGASSAERWMNCPGSVALLKRLDLPPSDESEFAAEGTAGHEAAAHCLAAGVDAWEIVGQKFYGREVNAEFAEHIQVYLDSVRPSIQGLHTQQFFIEVGLSSLRHKLMYGTVDFGALVDGQRANEMGISMAIHYNQGFLDVTDLKMGAGIVVEPEENEQEMYYAFLLIEQKFPRLADDFPVRLKIVQPRAFHQAGPIREWWTTVGYIKDWGNNKLLPAMEATAFDSNLDAGPWCRFCPAKLVCPLMESLFGAASKADPKKVVALTDDSLGRSYQYTAAVKMYLKALEDETFRRLQLGQDIPNTKLVNKKANRVFNPEVTPAMLQEKFGDDALTKPELKTPAEIEKLGPAAKAFVKEFAHTPFTGLTVALADDPRVGVKVEKASKVFAEAAKSLIDGTVQT